MLKTIKRLVAAARASGRLAVRRDPRIKPGTLCECGELAVVKRQNSCVCAGCALVEADLESYHRPPGMSLSEGPEAWRLEREARASLRQSLRLRAEREEQLAEEDAAFRSAVGPHGLAVDGYGHYPL